MVMDLEPFLKIENKYGLIQDEIDGFAYWTYFRCDLKWELEEILTSCDKIYAYPERSFLQRTKTRLESIKCALLYSRLPKRTCDILIFNHERRVWVKDCYECIYTDQIAARYPDSIVLERPYFQQHYRPVKTRNLVYTDNIEIKAMLYIYWQKFANKKKIEHLRKTLRGKIRKPLKEICEAYQITYDMNSILNKMIDGYLEYHVKKREFGKLLDSVKPKLILEVVGYDLDCMVLNEHAYKRHIPTIELQHGTTGSEHIPYNYYPGTKVIQAAQYFFAFSQFWIDAARYPQKKEHQIEIGFPYLDRRVAEVKKKVKRNVPAQIIFISQPSVGAILSEIAASLHQMIDAGQFQIVFKLHPDEYDGWRERYALLAASGIRVVDNNREDLYGLLAASTYQIGAYGSTATFEGLAFGLKTFALREGALAELHLLCEKKIARFFDNAEDLYRLLLEENDESKEPIRFWKENALENMKNEIEAIMNEGIS